MAIPSNLRRYREYVETEVASKRIAQLIGVARDFYLEPIQDIFVSEYRESDGRQVIRSVWMFSESQTMEFKNPLQEDNFDLAVIKGSVVWLVAERKDFDFVSWSGASRFTVKFKLASAIHGEFYASGKNCLELLRITRERMLPNAMRVPSVIMTDELGELQELGPHSLSE